MFFCEYVISDRQCGGGQVDLTRVHSAGGRCLMRKQRRGERKRGGWEGGEEQQVEGGREEEGVSGMGGVRDVFKTVSSSSCSSVPIAFCLSAPDQQPALILHSGKKMMTDFNTESCVFPFLRGCF